jgi:nucleotide-binding universal stress UspA family protein
MKEKLVVAVDGSAPSQKGLELAARLALALGLQLELVNVQPPVLLAPGVYADAIRLVEQAHARTSSEVLHAAANEVRRLGGGDVVTASLVGAPAEAIADHSRGEEVWAVVVGAKGHSAVGRVLLGSVADRLVHICNRPVLVVR